MATLIQRNGRWTLQFRIRPHLEKQTIGLGEVSELDANDAKKRVEALVHSIRFNNPPDLPTVAWAARLDDDLYAKLAKAGLVVPRHQSEDTETVPTLEKFIDDYINRRIDVKGATAICWGHTRRCLVEFFGATRPLNKITASEVEDFRRWMAKTGGRGKGHKKRTKSVEPLADNTVRRRCGIAKQFFRDAMRRRLITENPFADIKGGVKGNAAKDYFVSREESAKVLDACPDAQWRLLFVLSRYGGLRCPSEHLGLRWGDVTFPADDEPERGRLLIHSPKTEHHGGKETRLVPIFPELLPYLQDAYEEARADAEAMGGVVKPTDHVVTCYRLKNANLRTQLCRIIRRAGLKPWPKLFQNLRATRETELAETFPIHVVCQWIGNSEVVAKNHYLQVTEEHFRRAASPNNSASAIQAALQIALQTAGDLQRKAVHKKSETPENAGVCTGLHSDTPVGVGAKGLEPLTYSV